MCLIMVFRRKLVIQFKINDVNIMPFLKLNWGFIINYFEIFFITLLIKSCIQSG